MIGNDNLDKMKISAVAAVGIIAVIIGAMWAFMHDMPTRKDVESNEALSLRITSWVKEGQATERSERGALESRLQSQIDHGHEEVLHRLDVIDSDIKSILERLPRKVAQIQ